MPSVKKNFIYSSILTTANYLFPLITYPYVSRVLGVTNIGLCNFIDSIINYFSLFAAMGIGTIGIRVVAQYRNDKDKLSKAFCSLLALNAISTFIMLLLLIVATIAVPRLRENCDLMIVGAFKLIGNLFIINWFYQGLEDFKYVTLRTIMVKASYVVLIFVLIHSRNDYLVYFILSTAYFVGANALINIVHARKYVSFSLHGLNIKQYLSSFFILGFYALLTSMYTSFNVAFLGFAAGNDQVGYYTTANKLFSIAISLFSAFTGVMLPRMTSLLSEGKVSEFKDKINKSYRILIQMSLPVILVAIFFAPEIIRILSGKGYEGAIIPMRIMMPLVFIIGYEQILVIQTLMPMRKDKDILNNSILGATIGITLNFLIVPRLACIGSAIVWLCSEMSILMASQIEVHKYINSSFPFKEILVNFFYSTPIICLCVIARQNVFANAICALGLVCLVTFVYYYVLYIYVLKDPMLVKLCSINSIRSRFIRYKDI